LFERGAPFITTSSFVGEEYGRPALIEYTRNALDLSSILAIRRRAFLFIPSFRLFSSQYSITGLNQYNSVDGTNGSINGCFPKNTVKKLVRIRHGDIRCFTNNVFSVFGSNCPHLVFFQPVMLIS
jgi:hypothetical protein